jgi:hypothetical protein
MKTNEELPTGAISRRNFLTSLAIGGFAAGTNTSIASTADAPGGTSVPMLHSTDLYRPHDDPDDHWDLACVFALAHAGKVNLQVMIDYPQLTNNPDFNAANPDVMGVAQMNYLTSQAVPTTIGLQHPMRSRHDTMPKATLLEDSGVRALLRLLRKSPRPVVINVVGSCLSVAVAGMREPGLFSEKCAAIYLNAGTGSPDRTKAAVFEWNVSLMPSAYAAMFDLHCPVYWMPCFEEMPRPNHPEDLIGKAYGTHYSFLQSEILPHLSLGMKNYFAWMYKTGGIHWKSQKLPDPGLPGCDWLRYLLSPNDETLLARESALFRSCWCTAGFFHATGQTVTREGRIIPLTDGGADAVFTFEPVQVQCSDSGVTEWTKDPSSRDRFIFRVLDPERYPAAMTVAMRSLLQTIADA